MKKGLFITFEGCDGCGKTTQLNLTDELLRSKGYETVITKEPGYGSVGQEIRNIVLNNKEHIADKCEMFLFIADRAQHIETLIKPSVAEGKIVLCDRHTDSTLAYQGYGRGQDINLLRELNKIATDNIKPDLTLLYDLDSQTAQNRVGKEKDRMESAGLDFFEKTRYGYEELQKNEPERIKKIDASNSIEKVFEKTAGYIIELLETKQEK